MAPSSGTPVQGANSTRQRVHPFGGVLVGAAVPDVEQPVFDRVTLEIDHLAELSGRSLPEPEIECSDGHVDRIAIEYDAPGSDGIERNGAARTTGIAPAQTTYSGTRRNCQGWPDGGS